MVGFSVGWWYPTPWICPILEQQMAIGHTLSGEPVHFVYCSSSVACLPGWGGQFVSTNWGWFGAHLAWTRGFPIARKKNHKKSVEDMPVRSMFELS